MNTKNVSKEQKGNDANRVLSAFNLCGRTQKQQEKTEVKLLKDGSLWPKFDVLHKFIFTRKELNAVRKANIVIEQHKVKCKSINCA